jgi:hypothetical protein
MNQRSAAIATFALCTLLDSCGGGDNQSPSPTRSVVASDKSSVCPPNGSNNGIEGTGLRNKLTGQITGITVSDANTTVAVGKTGLIANGASVFQGTTTASLSDLRVDQIITAEADVGSAGDLCARSIFILGNGATAQLPFVQLGTNWAPFGGRTWGLFDGPFYSVLPQAQVLVDGAPVNVTDLTIDWGEIVLLGGQMSFPATYNPGGLLETSAVNITRMVDGPVDAIDILHNQIVVLGQTVFGTSGADTNTGVAFNVGDRVSVSGHPTASGSIAATRIALSANTGDFLVSGVVRAANPAQHVLTLNGVAIDYGTAQLSGVPAGGPTDGERISVRAVRPANGEALTATSIADDSRIVGAGIGTVVGMHGIVTQVYSSSLVSVDGYPIKISASALQTCGSTPPANSDVMLQGIIGTDGVIVADIYCFGIDTPVATSSWQSRQYSPVVQGTIQAIDPKYKTISILGLSAQPSPTTRVMDSDGSALTTDDLKVGDAIAVDGTYGSVPGLIEALGILRMKGVSQPTIQTSVLTVTVADPVFYIDRLFNNTYAHGWPIHTDTSTAYVGLTRAQFFAQQWEGNRHCPALLNVLVRVNADGSLTALWITETWKLDWCN